MRKARPKECKERYPNTPPHLLGSPMKDTQCQLQSLKCDTQVPAMDVTTMDGRWICDRDMEKMVCKVERWKRKQSQGAHTLWRKMELQSPQQWGMGRCEETRVRSCSGLPRGRAIVLLQLGSVLMSLAQVTKQRASWCLVWTTTRDHVDIWGHCSQGQAMLI